MATFYIGNLSRCNTTLADIENLFVPFGQLKEANLIIDEQTGPSEDYGFAYFNKQESTRAVSVKDKQELQEQLSFLYFSSPYFISKINILLEEVA